MTQRTPSTEDLETFLAIVEAGSMTGASRALRQPKSTLSRRLARLEADLGVRLFARGRHRLALTEAGAALVSPARDACASLRALSDAAESTRAAPTGRLRVSAPVDLLSLSALWLGFSARYPGVSLEVEPTNRHVDLVGERFDVALRGGRGQDEALVARAVGRYRLIAVASPAYLARWGRLDAPAALRRHSCLLFRAMERRPGHPDRPSPPHRHIICPDEGTALGGARAGLGIAILRAEVVQADLDAGALAPALDAYNPLEVPVYALYPERAHLRAAVSAFIEHAQTLLQ